MSSPSKADIAADTTLHLRKLLKINPFMTSDPTFPVPPREFCQTSARGSAKGSARQANETRILRLHAIGLNVRFGLVRGGPLRLGYGMPGGLCVSNPNRGSETIRPVSGRVRAFILRAYSETANSWGLRDYHMAPSTSSTARLESS